MPSGKTEVEKRQSLKEKCKEFKIKEIAGYYLYTELIVEQGFPKKHILFCSNHGDTTKEVRDAFKFAKICLPEIYKKSDSYVQTWVKERYENPYSRLRRGIIEGCQYVKTLINNDLPFNKVINKVDKKFSFEDIVDYVNVLEKFLPIQEPTDKSTLYKLFIRTLTHEWEAADPKQLSNKRDEMYAFASIMKMTRNWIAHNSTAIFNDLTEQDIAYLFICNMRAIFNLGHKVKGYEKILFPLLNDNTQETSLNIEQDKVILAKNYIKYFNELSNNKNYNHVDEILNSLQNDKQKILEKGNDFFIKGLYQLFWFLTSTEENTSNNTAQEHSDDLSQVVISRNYSFNAFNYAETEFLSKFSSHIYRRSFL
jgi:hypothetical protein